MHNVLPLPQIATTVHSAALLTPWDCSREPYNWSTPLQDTADQVRALKCSLGTAQLWKLQNESNHQAQVPLPDDCPPYGVLLVPLNGSLSIQYASEHIHLAQGQLLWLEGASSTLDLAGETEHIVFLIERTMAPGTPLPANSVDIQLFDAATTPSVKMIRAQLELCLAHATPLTELERTFVRRGLVEFLNLLLAEAKTKTSMEQRVNDAVSYIEGCLTSSELSAAKVAIQQNITRRHLDDLFSKTLGCTLSGFIKERRLQRAAELLLADSAQLLAVGDVANLVGYRCRVRFAKAFRERYGLAPQKWRVNHFSFEHARPGPWL